MLRCRSRDGRSIPSCRDRSSVARFVVSAGDDVPYLMRFVSSAFLAENAIEVSGYALRDVTSVS